MQWWKLVTLLGFIGYIMTLFLAILGLQYFPPLTNVQLGVYVGVLIVGFIGCFIAFTQAQLYVDLYERLKETERRTAPSYQPTKQELFNAIVLSIRKLVNMPDEPKKEDSGDFGVGNKK